MVPQEDSQSLPGVWPCLVWCGQHWQSGSKPHERRPCRRPSTVHQEASGSLLCRPSLWTATAQGLPACSSSMQPVGRRSLCVGPHETLLIDAACRSLGPPAWCPTHARCRAACARAMTCAGASGSPRLSDGQRRLPSAKRSSSASRTSNVQTLRPGVHPSGSNTHASAKQSACPHLTELEARWTVGYLLWVVAHCHAR